MKRSVDTWASKIRVNEPEPGEPIRVVWEKERLNTVCCDCDLAHNMRLTVRGKYVEVRVWRNEVMTKLFREKFINGPKS